MIWAMANIQQWQCHVTKLQSQLSNFLPPMQALHVDPKHSAPQVVGYRQPYTCPWNIKHGKPYAAGHSKTGGMSPELMMLGNRSGEELALIHAFLSWNWRDLSRMLCLGQAPVMLEDLYGLPVESHNLLLHKFSLILLRTTLNFIIIPIHCYE